MFFPAHVIKRREPFFPRALARAVPLARERFADPPPMALLRAYPAVPPKSKELYFPRARVRWAPFAFRAAGSPPAGLRRAYPATPPRSKELYFPRAKVRWGPQTKTAVSSTPSTDGLMIFVVTVTVLDAQGAQVTARVATKAMVTSSTDDPPSTLFRELVLDAGSIRRQVFSNGRNPGVVAPTWGTVTFQNTEGAFDGWLDHSTDGGKITCYYGTFGDPYPSAYTPVYVAYIDGPPVLDAKTVRFNLRGRERLFDKKVVTAAFEDTSGSYAGVLLERTGIPGSRMQFLVMGTPGYYEPILTNDLNYCFFVAGNPTASIFLYDGGVPLTYAGFIGSVPGQAGKFRITPQGTSGVAFAQPHSQVRFGLRVSTTGYFSTGTRWSIVNLATRAGVTGVDPSNLPTGSVNYDAGNRVVETQTYKDVFSDICAYQIASIGFDRLDRFYARPVVPSHTIVTRVYTFVDASSDSAGNSRNWNYAPIPGMERRVWQVGVKSGQTRKTALAGIVDDTIRDALSRDPWITNFVGNVTYHSGAPLFQDTTILDLEPTADREEVQIIGNEFTSRTAMEAWTLRYMQLHGAKTFNTWLEAPLNSDTLAIELLDGVELESNRFGGDRVAVVWSIDVQLKSRLIRFGCWSHRPYTTPLAENISVAAVGDVVGSSGGGAGGVAGHGDGASQTESFVVAASDKTSAITTGTNKQHWFVPYDFWVQDVHAGLDTVQTSGSVFTIDVNDAGTTILSTKLTIDNNEATSLTAATPAVISDNTLLKGTKVTFDVDQVGTGPKGWSVTIIGYQIT